MELIELPLADIHAILRANPVNIRYLDPQPEHLQLFALEQVVDQAKNKAWASIHEEVQRFFENYIVAASRAVKLAALNHAPNLIRHFSEHASDPEFQTIVVEKSPNHQNIQFLTDLSEDLLIQSIDKFKGYMAVYINKLPVASNQLIEAFVDRAPNYVECLDKKYRTPDILMRAVKLNSKVIGRLDVDEYFPELLETAIKLKPAVIEDIHQPSIELQILAVTLYPPAINRLDKPVAYEVQLAAVKQDGMVLKYIRHIARREVQYQAILQNPEAIQYVKKPTLEMKLIAG